MGRYLELAAKERTLARAAYERARLARSASHEAAFQDTADRLAREAVEEQQRGDAHLDAARRYERQAAAR